MDSGNQQSSQADSSKSKAPVLGPQSQLDPEYPWGLESDVGAFEWSMTLRTGIDAKILLP